MKNIVKYLRQSSKVDKIYYPTDLSFRQKKITKKQMIDGGSIISFELKSLEENKKKFELAKVMIF